MMLAALIPFLDKTPHEVVAIVIRVKNDSQVLMPEEMEFNIPATADEIREFLNR